MFITGSLLMDAVAGVQNKIETIGTDIGFKFLDFGMDLIVGGGSKGQQGKEYELRGC